MNIPRFLLLALFFAPFVVSGSEVAEVCSEAEIGVENLVEVLDSKKPFDIKSINPGHSHKAKLYSDYLKSEFAQSSLDLNRLFADSMNLMNSEDERIVSFMVEAELMDANEQRKALFRFMSKVFPKVRDYMIGQARFFKMSSILHLVDISRTPSMSMGLTRYLGSSEKLSLEPRIFLSSGNYVGFPSLFLTLVHESQHLGSLHYFYVRSQKDKEAIKHFGRGKEERDALEVELKAYLYLAQSYPGIFCDWLTPNVELGGLAVPLSWEMAVLEESLKDPSFLPKYLSIERALSSTGN